MPSKFMLFIIYIKRVQLTFGVYISVTTTTLIHMCDISLPQIRHNGTMGGWVGHQYFFTKKLTDKDIAFTAS